MSHFKLLVIGENIEEQLAPYSEELTVEAYKDESYDHAETMQRARSFYTEHPDCLPVGGLDLQNERALIEAYIDGDEGIRWVTNEAGDEVSEKWTTYNPQSKWDYWVIGGRYSGSFRIKKGASAEDYTPAEGHWSDRLQREKPNYKGRSDSALKHAIDFDAMETLARGEGLKSWLELQEATEGITPPQRDWKATLTAHKGDAKAAREEWYAHPWNKATSDAHLWDAYEQFHMSADNPMEAYLDERAAFARGGFYAVVKNGEWQAQGKMGWFGMSDDTVDSKTWYKQVALIISELPHGTRLTTVDCHI